MSKARDWAKALEAARARLVTVEREDIPRFFLADGSGSPVAWADTDGSPYFEKVHGRWSQEHALALAKWIGDTFGEEPRP